MKEFFAVELGSPFTGKRYQLHIDEEVDGCVKNGKLITPDETETVLIKNFIPRFVFDSNYADSFGLQWNLFRKTQLDSVNGTTLTRDRLYSGTNWDPAKLQGQRILEAGCGAGRFTEILLQTGATVYSFDYSSAVDACYQNNKSDNLLIFQGDMYHIPFTECYFDKVFCYGVLQHTPHPKTAFMNLARYVKRGGDIAVDIYRKDGRIGPEKSKYLWRFITTRMKPDSLFKFVQWYIPKWMPADTFLKTQKIRLLKGITVLIPCWNYIHLPLTQQQKLEWAILDTFDALSPKYDKPQTIKEVTSWFEEAHLENIDIREGGNGIIGNARKR